MLLRCWGGYWSASCENDCWWLHKPQGTYYTALCWWGQGTARHDPSLEVSRCDGRGCHLEVWTCRMNQRNFNQSSAGTRPRCLSFPDKKEVITTRIIQTQSLPICTSIQHCSSLFLSLHTHQQVFTDPPFIHVGDFSDMTHKSANNGLALWEKFQKQTDF